MIASSSVLSVSKFLIVVGLLFLTFGCQSLYQADDMSGMWIAQTDSEEAPTIQFEQQEIVNGYDGCNRYFGTYAIDGNESLSIVISGVTKKYCHNSASADAFIEFLNDVSKATIEDDTLILYAGKTNSSRTFSKYENDKR
jgi:heat shock protein HslJ